MLFLLQSETDQRDVHGRRTNLGSTKNLAQKRKKRKKKRRTKNVTRFEYIIHRHRPNRIYLFGQQIIPV